jgi:hypothetical protein
MRDLGIPVDLLTSLIVLWSADIVDIFLWGHVFENKPKKNEDVSL